MKKLITFLLLACFVSSFANEIQRKKQLMNIIGEELNEVVRLNNQTNGTNPNLRLQMAELQLEKARILKEIEHDKYLSLPASKRRKANKDRYYRGSKKLFVQAKDNCRYILSKYPGFSKKADAYYILAYYSRDIARDTNKAIKYFTASKQFSKKRSEIWNKSVMALAEIYYSQRNYKKAIPLFETALAGKKNKWWTKDAHSLSWSYFRAGRKTKAINTLERVRTLSKNSKYIDMSKAAERDLAYFYSSTGQTEKAVNLSKSVKGDRVDYLIKVALNTKEQGQYKNSSKILKNALKVKPITTHQKRRIHFILADTNERYNYFGSLLINVKALNELNKIEKFSNHDRESLKFYAQKAASSLQTQVVSKTYRHNKKLRAKKAHQAKDYFGVLKDMYPKDAYKYDFLIAETYYAVNYFTTAVPYYAQALEGANKAKDKKTSKESLAGLSLCLEKKSVPKKVKDKYLTATYLEYLKKNPRSKQSKKVYQRLFTLYFDKKDINSSVRVLDMFKKAFPRDIGVQEAMLGKIIDYEKSKSNVPAMREWYAKIDKGQYTVNPKFKKNLKDSIAFLRFKGVEASSSKGDKVAALRGYIALYADKKSTNSERKVAAYQVAILFDMLGDTDQTYKWSMEALKYMTPADVKKFEKTFIVLATSIFNKRKFNEAISLNQKVYEKLCRTKSRNKVIFFSNVNILKIADGRVDELPNFLATGVKCGVPSSDLNNMRLEVIKGFAEEDSWESVKNQISILERNKSFRPNLIVPLNGLYNAYNDAGRLKLANSIRKKILSYYEYSRRNKKNISIEALDAVANFKLQDLYREKQNLSKVKLRFPEKQYNFILKDKFKRLDRFSAKALALASVGSGKGITRSYRYVIDAYEALAKEVQDFVPPKKSKEYVKSFKAAMDKQVVSTILAQAEKFKRDGAKAIMNNTILSADNSYFLSNKKLPVPVQFDYFRKGVIMDRGGRR